MGEETLVEKKSEDDPTLYPSGKPSPTMPSLGPPQGEELKRLTRESVQVMVDHLNRKFPHAAKVAPGRSSRS